MKLLSFPAIVSILLVTLGQLHAVTIIGHNQAEWATTEHHNGGVFNLSATPGYLASGATSGMVMGYKTELFPNPVIGSAYTISASIVIPLLQHVNLFVIGFSTTPQQSIGSNYMQLVFQQTPTGDSAIMWFAGTINEIPNYDPNLLTQFLYSGNTLSGTKSTNIDITWTYNGDLNWTMSGSIISGVEEEDSWVTLWDTTTNVTASGEIFENNSSAFYLGTPLGFATVNSGEFTGPVPEPTSAILVSSSLLLLAMRRRKPKAK